MTVEQKIDRIIEALEYLVSVSNIPAKYTNTFFEMLDGLKED